MKPLKWIGLVLFFALIGSSAFSAQDPSVLLEKAMYAEETLGNLQEAIGIYQQIVNAAEANRATAALALYRLGLCYQKSGRTEDAQATFSKLTKSYPEQQELISKIPGASSGGLELRAAPWIDGEVLQLSARVNLNTQKGPTETGTFTYKFEAAKENGKPVWIFESLMEQGAMGIIQFSKVSVDASRMIPIRSSIKSPMMGMRYQLTYSSEKVEQLNIKKDGSVSTTIVPLNRPVYDQSELEMLIRCLPLREGYQASISGVAPAATFVYDIKIVVAGREKVAVPAGTFDCYKVLVNQAGQERVYWISADAHAYIVKSTLSEMVTLELNSIKRADKNQPASFEDPELGITISAPPQWYIGHSSLPPGIHLTEPETEADGILTVSDEPGKEPDNPSTWIDSAVSKYIAGMQKQRPGYAVRPESRSAVTVAGAPATSFIADCKHLITGQAVVEYIYFFTRSGKTYQLILQAGAEQFDKMKSDFESIVSSLRVQ
jgi:hypothetical protein